VLVPGNPDKSPLVFLVEGKEKPKMPPKAARRHPKAAEIALLRAWVKSGAKDDSTDLKAFIPDIKPRVPTAAAVAALAYRPDGKTLASCGYDKLIKLWDVPSGKEVRTLREHSDSVYAVAFNPDGKLLASAAADRAVKLWEAATGRLLYTLGEPTDWVYAA